MRSTANEADAPFEQEANESGGHEIEGADFDGQLYIGGAGLRGLSTKSARRRPPAARVKVAGNWMRPGAAAGTERTQDIQVGCRSLFGHRPGACRG